MQALFFALVDCIEDGLESSCYIQFAKNALHMGVDGLLAYEKLIADLFIRATGGEVTENFVLFWRQNGLVCFSLILDRKSPHHISSPLLIRPLYP
jgi:hypothetical protein